MPLVYYTLLSLSPLLTMAVPIDGPIFGREVAQGHIVAQIAGLVGAIAAHAMIESAP